MPLPNNLYTADQVRELDRIAIEDFGILGITLMQRAAQATFNHLRRAYPKAQSLCVVCGTGNNGGDGYFMATFAKQAGLAVSLIQLGNQDAIKGDALSARNAFLKTGANSQNFNEDLLDCDIIIDAIFGTGLDRDVEGDWANAIDAINQSRAKCVAVDIPSGLNADTGRIFKSAVKADLCVTYIAMKCGLVTGQARDYVGELQFDDLGVPDNVYDQLNDTLDKRLIPEDIIQQHLKPRPPSSHKGHFGHVLLIGGAQGMSGAIRLAAEASLRTGAGLVSVATDPAHADLLNQTRPEIMVSGISDAEALQPLIDKANVMAIGPGLGKSDWAKKLLKMALKSGKPLVIDADALNLLSELPNIRLQNAILTPHPAESARLLGISTPQVEQNRYQSILKNVRNRGGVFILKGSGTLISDGKLTSVCSAGNSGMATGGMGDVLTGIIAALLAQGLSLFDAAETGVAIHAKAGDLAAGKHPRGLIASDLFPPIRKLVNP